MSVGAFVGQIAKNDANVEVTVGTALAARAAAKQDELRQPLAIGSARRVAKQGKCRRGRRRQAFGRVGRNRQLGFHVPEYSHFERKQKRAEGISCSSTVVSETARLLDLGHSRCPKVWQTQQSRFGHKQPSMAPSLKAALGEKQKWQLIAGTGTCQNVRRSTEDRTGTGHLRFPR